MFCHYFYLKLKIHFFCLDEGSSLSKQTLLNQVKVLAHLLFSNCFLLKPRKLCVDINLSTGFLSDNYFFLSTKQKAWKQSHVWCVNIVIFLSNQVYFSLLLQLVSVSSSVHLLKGWSLCRIVKAKVNSRGL